MTDSEDAVLIGGPLDNSRYSDPEGPLLELAEAGLIHRYVKTNQVREVSGAQLTVYQFDGTVSPDGGLPGTEDPEQRLASPLAEEMRENPEPDETP